MTEEERFSTIKMTKKTKNADSSPTYTPLEMGVFSAKKDKNKSKYTLVVNFFRIVYLSCLSSSILYNLTE
jgi:hypothetical protein